MQSVYMHECVHKIAESKGKAEGKADGTSRRGCSSAQRKESDVSE